MESSRKPLPGVSASTRRHRAAQKVGRPLVALCAALAWASALAEDAAEPVAVAEEAPTPAAAAPVAEENEAPAAESPQPQQPQQPQERDPDDESEPADVFTPTESISEDISVPFPVDI